VILLPEIRDQLHAAANRRATVPGARRRFWRPTAGLLAPAASIMVVAVVVGVFLLYAHHTPGGIGTTGGPTGHTPPAAWVKLRNDALAQSRSHDAGCRTHLLSGASRLRYGAPDERLASELAVLRHPAPQRVSLPELRRVAGGPLDARARGIYIRYVRRGQMNGVTYYLIPAANVTQVRATPGRCYHEQLTAFRQSSVRLPAADRAAAVRYEITSLQTARTLARHPAGVCLIHTTGRGTGFGPCATSVSLRHLPGTPFGAGSDGNDQATVTPLIVPNNIATVTAYYRPQTYPGRVPDPVTVTQHVRNNIAVFDLHGAWDPPSLTYRSANGSVIWSSRRR
jgi:hypothetical protein